MAATPYRPPRTELGKPAKTPRLRSFWWGALCGAVPWGVVACFSLFIGIPSPLMWLVKKLYGAPEWALNTIGFSLSWLWSVHLVGVFIYGTAGALIALALGLVSRRRDG